MGRSATGHLWWGWLLGEDPADPDPENWDAEKPPRPAWLEDDEDWEGELARVAGETDPHPPDQDWTEWYAHPANKELVTAHWARKKAIVEAAAGTIGYVGAVGDGYTEWFVALRGRKFRGDWGGSHELSPADLAGPDDPEAAREALAGFLRSLRLPVPDREPGWHLSASYG
jgi:hypothetical protein